MPLELVILSCDKYADLWEHHINLLQKYWCLSEIKISLVSESDCGKSFQNVNIIKAGSKEFSSRLEYALSFIESKYVLLILDDYFLCNKVSFDKIKNLIDECEQKNVDYIRLFKRPKHSVKEEFANGFYRIDTSDNYAVNLFPSIWKTEKLRETFIKPASAWEYEVSLSKTAFCKNFLCLMASESLFPIVDILRKGKIKRSAKAFLRKENIKIERETHFLFSEIFYNIRLFLSENLPRPIFRLIKKTTQKMGAKFYSDI